MKIRPQRYHLALVLNPLFFPVTFPDCGESLSKRGFFVVPTPPKTLIFGGRAYLNGRIAEKRNVNVEINSDQKTIACEGVNVSEVILIFNEILDMLYKDFSVSKDEIDYLELVMSCVVSSDNNPIQRLADINKGTEITDIFEKVLKKPMSIYTIGLNPKDTLPSSKSWFDIRIEPRLTKPEEEYYVSIVFRDNNLDEVLNFAKDVESLVIRILSKIEGE